MTPELIDLARRAMALERAPLSALWRLGLVRHDDTGNVIVDLADTGADGWAIGGVLLGALGEDRWRMRPMRKSFTWHNGDDHPCAYPWRDASTLAEACCRVALARGDWPGGL